MDMLTRYGRGEVSLRDKEAGTPTSCTLVIFRLTFASRTLTGSGADVRGLRNVSPHRSFLRFRTGSMPDHRMGRIEVPCLEALSGRPRRIHNLVPLFGIHLLTRVLLGAYRRVNESLAVREPAG